MIHHNTSAERAILGCCMLDQECLSQAIASLDRKSFHSPTNLKVWQAVVESQKTCGIADMVTVADILTRWNQIDQISYSYLAQIMADTPSTSNFESWLGIIVNASRMRSLMELSATIHAATAEDVTKDPMSICADIQVSLDSILAGGGGIGDAVHVGEGVVAALESLTIVAGGGRVGIDTGFSLFDAMVGGLKPGEMIVLAARPSIGKTALAMNIAANIAMSHNDTPVGVFSLEMSRSALTSRLLAAEAELSRDDVINGISVSQMHRVAAAAERIRHSPIYIDDASRPTIVELRAKALRMRKRHGIGFIVIDYLQLMKASGGNKNGTREQEITQISSGIKALAKELNVPILVLAQLNRQAEGAERPKLSHLRESGSIEQDADLVLLLHRDRTTQITASSDRLPTDLIIAKNRNGEVGCVTLDFVAPFAKFDNALPQGYESFHWRGLKT